MVIERNETKTEDAIKVSSLMKMLVISASNLSNRERRGSAAYKEKKGNNEEISLPHEVHFIGAINLRW